MLASLVGYLPNSKDGAGDDGWKRRWAEQENWRSMGWEFGPSFFYGILCMSVYLKKERGNLTWKIMALSLFKAKGKQLRLSTKGRKLLPKDPEDSTLTRDPGEVYASNVLLPSGITNPALNCYCNAREIYQAHPEKCGSACRTMSRCIYNK